MRKAKNIQDIQASPFFAQFSEDQLKTQLQKCLEGLEQMHAQACITGKRVGGFTVQQLEQMIENYKTILK